jgi:hypothetical protein
MFASAELDNGNQDHLGKSRGRQVMDTTQKLQRNSVGDYIYKDTYIMRGEVHASWIVAIRGNNGHIRYKRCKTLKQACAYIDYQQNESVKETK